MVSILLPCFNAGPFLEAAIRSVLAQSFENLELLFCDDCSTDESFSVASAIADEDERIRLYQNPRNLGKIDTVNRLLREAKGQFIGFIDADDIISPNKIASQLEFLQENPEYSFCGTDLVRITPAGREYTSEELPKTDADIRSSIIAASGMAVCGASIVFRAEYVSYVKGFREYFKGAVGEDVDFAARLLDVGKGANLPIAAYRYRYGPNSLTRGVASLVRQRHSHEIIAFLAKERWKTGRSSDSLDQESVQYRQFMGKLSEPYTADSGLMHRKMAFDYALRGDTVSAAKFLAASFKLRSCHKWAKLLCTLVVIAVIPTPWLLHLKAKYSVSNVSRKL